MTPHINAKLGDYAEVVLMPGDPVRAKYIATTFLDDCVQVNSARNCLGYTGYYKGKRVSVQASGMGQPSLGIYATELFTVYGVEKIIRVGTCGALVDDLNLGDCVVSLTAATDSNVTTALLPRFTLAPCCSYALLDAYLKVAESSPLPVRVGQTVATDAYYQEQDDWWKVLASYGVIAVDMETHYLYFLANKLGKQALTVNMVSDRLTDWTKMSIADKETKIHDIAKTILDSL